MVTRAVVVSVNGIRATVRIPIYNKISGVNGATPDSELYSAIICTPNNTVPNIVAGDTVFVAFEESQMDKPVIIGHLPKTEILPDVGSEIGCKSIRVFDDTTIDGDINIKSFEGNQSVNKINLLSLFGMTDNIRDKFESVDSEMNTLSALLGSLAGRATDLHTSIVGTEELLESSAQSLSGLLDSLTYLTSRVASSEEKLESLEDNLNALTGQLSALSESLNDKIVTAENRCVSKSTPLLEEGAYGSTLPESAKKGQLFFKIE